MTQRGSGPSGQRPTRKAAFEAPRRRPSSGQSQKCLAHHDSPPRIARATVHAHAAGRVARRALNVRVVTHRRGIDAVLIGALVAVLVTVAILPFMPGLRGDLLARIFAAISLVASIGGLALGYGPIAQRFRTDRYYTGVWPRRNDWVLVLAGVTGIVIWGRPPGLVAAPLVREDTRAGRRPVSRPGGSFKWARS